MENRERKNMDEIELKIARREFLDHLEDILEKDPGLRDDPNAMMLIQNNALAMAQEEMSKHGRLVTTARNYARTAVSKTREYLKSRQGESEPAPRRKAEAPTVDQDEGEMSEAEYAQFFRGMSQRAQRRPAESRSEEKD
jgi:hypothetical protein